MSKSQREITKNICKVDQMMQDIKNSIDKIPDREIIMMYNDVVRLQATTLLKMVNEMA